MSRSYGYVWMIIWMYYMDDYNSTDVADILNIQKYLIVKNNMKCLDLLENFYQVIEF